MRAVKASSLKDNDEEYWDGVHMHRLVKGIIEVIRPLEPYRITSRKTKRVVEILKEAQDVIWAEWLRE